MQGFQDVFISCGRKDSLAFVDQLNRRLVALVLDVWFDFDDIPVGVDYQKQIWHRGSVAGLSSPGIARPLSE